MDKKVVVLHVRVDLVDGEVNQHTCDLGGLVAGKTLNECVDDGTNVLLVVGVLFNNRVQDWHGLGEIISVNAALGSYGNGHTSTSHWDGHAGNNGHGHGHVHGHVVGHGGTLVHSGLVGALLVLLTATLIVVAGLASVFTLLVTVVLLTRLAHLLVLMLAALVVLAGNSFATLVGVLLGWLFEVTLMHQKSEQVNELVRILEIGEGTCVFGLVALEVLFVLLGLVVHVTVLFDLVVVDVQGVVVELLLGELGLGGGGLVRGLVADEGEGRLLVFDGEELE